MKTVHFIYGGTFDPVHNGHVSVVEHLKQAFFGIEAFKCHIHVVPCKLPVHKPNAHASAEQRKHMLELAFEQDEAVTIDTRELDRTSPSFMQETLASFRQQYPEANLILVMGADSFAKIHTWKKWYGLFDLANVLAVERPGEALLLHSEAKLLESRLILNAQELLSVDRGKLLFFQANTVDTSSTNVRDQLQHSKPEKLAVPAKVFDFIQSHELYGVTY